MENLFNTIEEALDDLKQGRVIIICDNETPSSTSSLIALGDLANNSTAKFMSNNAKGALLLPADASVLHQLNPPSQLLPIATINNGVLAHEGHAEAAVDLAILSKTRPYSMLCEIHNTDSTITNHEYMLLLAQRFNLKLITIKELVRYRKQHDVLVTLEANANLPSRYGNFIIYAFNAVLDGSEIAVISKGITTNNIHRDNLCNHKSDTSNSHANFNTQSVLVRVHSECFTGDVLHSLCCDCGDQLEQALTLFADYQKAVLIYLPQEGRGIGLTNKIKAYSLQQNNQLDTFDANQYLGFAPDNREYYLAAQILRILNIDNIHLLTNNPNKLLQLQQCGITVAKRISLVTTVHAKNRDYINTKITKFGHWL